MRFVDVAGVLAKARKSVFGSDGVSEGDVQDSRKLTEILRGVMRRITSLEANAPPDAVEFEVDIQAGGTVNLQHGFGCPVRFQVTSWKASAPQTPNQVLSWVDRSWSIGTNGMVAGNFTVGASYRMLRLRTINGIRFVWNSNAGHTLRVVLWNNSTGAVIAEKTVSTTQAGVHEAIFDTPITQDLTGVDITCSVYETGAATYCANSSATLLTLIKMSEDIRAVSRVLWSAGNARPTSSAVTETYSVEPILERDMDCHVSLNATNTTSDILCLNCYSTGRAIVKVEPSQFTPRYS